VAKRSEENLDEQQQASIRQLKTACELLTRVDVALVEVKYNGSKGWSASKEITAYDDAGRALPPPEDPLFEIIEEGVEALLPRNWKTDTGSFGRMSISTRTRSAFLSHVDRQQGAASKTFDLRHLAVQ
jgi:hypothetical protein